MLPDRTSTLLTCFAVAMNRRRAYRPSHPMVVRAEQQLLETITTVMANREELTLGIGPRELLLDGKRLRSRLSVTREVASRLHRRGVSSLTLLPDITGDSVRSLLGWLTADRGASSAAADAVTGGAPDVPGFLIGRIDYDRLVLRDSVASNEEQVASIWRALAHTAMPAVRGASAAADTATAEQIVAAIRSGIDDPEYARRVSVTLFTLVDQATHATPRQRALLGERLRAILAALDERSLTAILAQVGGPEQQHAFMARVTEALPLDAVVEWLEVAAHTRQQNLSHHLLRLLRKLSGLARDRVRGSATDMSFRDAAHDLVSGWELEDPNPDEHIELLDQIALIEAERTTRPDTVSPDALLADQQQESVRLIQMALEVDEVSDDARFAVHQLVLGGHAARLLAWIDEADAPTAVAQLRSAAASPDALMALLLRDTPDVEVARSLVSYAGEDAIPALFDVLATSTSRRIRRLVYDRLRDFGRVIWPELSPRLENTTWFFARNLLGLMRDIRIAERRDGGDLQSLPLAGVTRYLSHEREQPRLEAVRLLLSDPSMREGTLRRAFDDTSPRVIREALEAVIALAAETADETASLPERLFTRVLELVDDERLPPEIRARAVWALDAWSGTATCSWLLAHTTRKHWLTRRLVLADGRPTVLAALGLLARRYARDPRASRVLTMARATDDLRSHAASGTPPQTPDAGNAE